MRVQSIDDRAAFVFVITLDQRGHQLVHVKRPPPGFRVRDDGRLPVVIVPVDTVLEVHPFRGEIFIDVQHVPAVDLILQLVGQRFPGRVHVREQRVTADAGYLHRIQHGPPVRFRRIALVVVEKHLAVGKRPDRHAALPDVRHQHDILGLRALRPVLGLAQPAAQRRELLAECPLGFGG